MHVIYIKKTGWPLGNWQSANSRETKTEQKTDEEGSK
jgi:hypothetical protein